VSLTLDDQLPWYSSKVEFPDYQTKDSLVPTPGKWLPSGHMGTGCQPTKTHSFVSQLPLLHAFPVVSLALVQLEVHTHPPTHTLLRHCWWLYQLTLFFFYDTGVWTQGLYLADRHFTTWAMPPTLFWFSYFSNRVSPWSSQLGPWFSYLHFYIPMVTGHTTLPSFYWMRWGLTFLHFFFFFLGPGLASNLDPPSLCLSHS
jgi:hypothetical protein